MGKNTLRLGTTLFLYLLFNTINAQVLRGTVNDEGGLPLPGAAIVIKEQPDIGAATDFDGNFKLENFKPGDITLVISFIGYEDKEIPVTIAAGQNKSLDIKMTESSNQLDEVVLVGYGVQRRRDNTGSIVKLKSKDLNDMPTPSFETAIQGKAPGVQIITGSGLAASPSVVRIRGIASISAAGDPLYVVDGIPITQDYFTNGNSGGMNTNPLATINPNDIESVEILKDASATAIYGSRGANGVIIITTKRGTKGGLRFGFNTTLGVSQPTNRPDMLNASQYLQLYEEAWINDGNVGTPTFPFVDMSWEEAQRHNTDWVDQTIGTGFKQFYDFNVQKGNEKYNFYLGGSYDINESYLKGNSYVRLSGRANGDVRINDKLKLSISSSISRGDNNRVDAAWSGGLGAAMSTALPIYPVYWDTYNIDGNGDTLNRPGDFWTKAGIGNNPVAFREKKIWRVREYRSINSLNLTYSPMPNLHFTATGSYDYMKQIEDVFLERELHGFTDIEGGIAIRTPRRIHNFNTFLTSTYEYKVNKDNKLTFLLGTEFQQSENYIDGFITETEDGNRSISNVFLDVNAPFYDLGLNNDVFDTTFAEPNKKFNFLSYFTRINYSFKGRYLAQAVMRADGSSKFGPDKRFGFFPSLSVGWIMSDENFLKNNRLINYMKLKASYGFVGSAGIEPEQWRSNYYFDQIGYNQQPITGPTVQPNSDLQWESSRVFDAGIEIGLLDDRITAELAYYHKLSSEVFLIVSPPRYNGFSSFTDNIGEILNEGVEFQITGRILTKGELQWTTNFNVAYNYNEITSIGGFSEDAVSGGTNDTRTVVGYPVGTNFLVRFSHVDQETGRPVYLDLDGNPTFEWNPDNRVAVGKVLPDAVGGITNNFRYKNWDLSFLFVYSIGGNIYDSSSKRQLGRVDGWNKTEHIFDRWTQAGDDATYPLLTLDAANHGSTTPWINTTLYLHDASYMRLRNLTIGYNLPRKLVERMKIKSMRVSLIGTNLLTFTKYPGIDPEIARDFENATDRNMSPNISYLTPPQEKTYSIAINLTF